MSFEAPVDAGGMRGSSMDLGTFLANLEAAIPKTKDGAGGFQAEYDMIVKCLEVFGGTLPDESDHLFALRETGAGEKRAGYTGMSILFPTPQGWDGRFKNSGGILKKYEAQVGVGQTGAWGEFLKAYQAFEP